MQDSHPAGARPSSTLVLSLSKWRREKWATKVPVPRLTPHAGSRVLERLELQPGRWNAVRGAIRQQPCLVRGYQMCHRTPFPHMAMHPESAVHGVDHSVTPSLEFSV